MGPWAIYRGERRQVAAAAGVLALLELGEALAASAADAIYLGRAGAHALGWQLAASSALLVVTLGVWGALADRRERARLLAAGALFAALGLVGLRAALWAWPAAAPHALLIVTKQLAAALDLGFWVLVADRFDARQARRLVPALAAAGGVGLVAGALATRPLAHALGAEALLLLAAGAHALAAGAAWTLSGGAGEAGGVRRVGAVGAGGAAASLLASWREAAAAVRASALARRLAWVVALGGAAAPMIYALLGLAAERRFASEEALAGFYGLVRAGTHGATLAAQVLLAPLLWRRIGVAGALQPAPLVAVAAGLCFAGAPVVAVAVAASAAARLVDATFQSPAEKLALNLLPAGVRGRVGAFLDGVAKRAGAILGGAAAALAVALGGAVALGAAAAAAGAAWAAVAAALGRRYGALAVDALAGGEGEDADDEDDGEGLDEAARRALLADLGAADDTRVERSIARLAGEPGAAALFVGAAAAAAGGAGARRARLLAAAGAALAHEAARAGPGAPSAPSAVGPAGPAGPGDADAAIAALAAREDLAVDERIVVARAAAALASPTGFAAAEPILGRWVGGDAAAAVRLAATAALLARLGEREGLAAAVDAVLALSPEARAAASRALLLGQALAAVDATTSRVAMGELVGLVRAAEPGSAARARWRAWVVAAAHGDPARAAPALEALAGWAGELDEETLGDVRARARELLEAEEDLDGGARSAAARALAARPEERDLALLARLLEDRDAAVRGAARRGLVALGAPALPALLLAARYGRADARDAALAALGSMRVAPAALEAVIDGELQALARLRAHRHVLAEAAAGAAPVAVADAAAAVDVDAAAAIDSVAAAAPASASSILSATAVGGAADALQLLALRLDERAHEVARALLGVVEARLGARRVGVVAARWAEAPDARARARALEALDALLPRALAARVLPALEDVDAEERLRRAVVALGGLPDADAALVAELAGHDELARLLAVQALGRRGRAAHRAALRAAALAGLDRADARGLVARLAGGDGDARSDRLGLVDTMLALRRTPVAAGLGVRRLADLAARVRWRVVRAGATLAADASTTLLVVTPAGVSAARAPFSAPADTVVGLLGDG